MYETDNEYVVRVEIAGMQEEDFEIYLENNLVFIRGNRTDKPERRAYQQMEIRFGKFETAVGVPGPIDAEAARADYSGGFLTVTLPKAKSTNVGVEES
jgi:HSP20 family protein